MMNYQILTDSGSDLPKELVQQLELSLIPLSVNFDGQTLPDTVDGNIRELYQGFRDGKSATTSAINPAAWAEAMKKILDQEQDVLTITFSSGLSTTYQSAVIAAEELKEAYPQRKILVVDSLCASLGQGMLVYTAAKKRLAGMDMESLYQWLEENKLSQCHWFTVDDLSFLKRGGRVSATTALVGTMLQIKPVLHVDDEGHLINVSKARGRKASIQALEKKMEELMLPDGNETVFICHGDCIDDANYLAQLVKERCGVKEVIIGYTGAVIGSHSGPGTLALFFFGSRR
ncbi:MAG: DegV family protein [Oscillospiraceae bacterium]|nr:DegV family protein [Oscillospiraceae bacterium]